MSCYQIASFRPQVNLKAKYHGGRGLPPPMAHIPAVRFPTIPRTYPKLSAQRLKYQWHSPTCLFGGKDKSQGNDQDPPWKGLQDTFGNIGGKPSVEEMLRKQVEKQEYFGEEAGGGGDDGGGGGRSSRRGGGGGSGADDDDDDSEDSKGGREETFAEVMDEILQMTLAIVGVIFVYFYIIYPQDVKLYTKDFIRFFLTRKKSYRVKEITDAFEEFWDRLTYTKEPVGDAAPLEELILNTTTWWDSPEKHRRLNKQYMKDERIDFDSFDFPTPSSGNVADAQIDSDDKADDESGDTADDESGDTANAESGDTADDERAYKIDWDHLIENARLACPHMFSGDTLSADRLSGDKDDNDINSGDTSRTSADMDDDDINSGDTESSDIDDDNPDDGYYSGTDDTDSDS